MQLFKTKLHTAITLATLIVAVWALYTIVQFLINADWQVIIDKRRAFMIGRYPEEHVWRIWPTVTTLPRPPAPVQTIALTT